jgi:hypothetical protein
MTGSGTAPTLQVRGELLPRSEEVLTPDALALVASPAPGLADRRAEMTGPTARATTRTMGVDAGLAGAELRPVLVAA